MSVRIIAFVSVMLVAFTLRASEIVDGRGVRHSFSTPPKAVSLAPSITDMIFEIGAQEYLVAVSAFSDIRGEKIECVGSVFGIDWEKLVSLKPDVVIVPNVQDSAIAQRLSQCGIKCIYLHKEGAISIAEDLVLFGEIFCKQSKAQALANEFQKELSNRHNGDKVRALFLFSSVSAGKGSFVSDILNLCGFENCADKTNATWPILSREFILTENPDVLFVVSSSPQQQKYELARLRSDIAWSATKAVSNNNVYFIKYDDIILPSVRVLNAIKYLRNVRKAFK